mmetsp:Transcript_116712/g.337108  ORF Transcript_116712/g.337108 Transcript_116712/m.337108 type:complete len:228 (+) Transcript_116712:54-737(+)
MHQAPRYSEARAAVLVELRLLRQHLLVGHIVSVLLQHATRLGQVDEGVHDVRGAGPEAAALSGRHVGHLEGVGLQIDRLQGLDDLPPPALDELAHEEQGPGLLPRVGCEGVGLRQQREGDLDVVLGDLAEEIRHALIALDVTQPLQLLLVEPRRRLNGAELQLGHLQPRPERHLGHRVRAEGAQLACDAVHRPIAAEARDDLYLFFERHELIIAQQGRRILRIHPHH